MMLDHFMFLYGPIVYALVGIILFIIERKVSKKTRNNTPVDDSTRKINHEQLEKLGRRFVTNKDETLVSVLGRFNMEELINSTVEKNGFALLTTKAIYFIGKIYHTKYIIPLKMNVQHRKPLQEIKGIKVINQSDMISIPVAFIEFILWIKNIKWLIEMNKWRGCFEYTISNYIAMTVCIIAISMLLVFMISSFISGLNYKRLVIIIEFDKESFRFPVNWLGKQEIKDFYKAISQTQERVNSDRVALENEPKTEFAKAEQNPVITNQSNSSQSNSKLQELSELGELFNNKIITEEEFAKLKQEIINR